MRYVRKQKAFARSGKVYFIFGSNDDTSTRVHRNTISNHTTANTTVYIARRKIYEYACRNEWKVMFCTKQPTRKKSENWRKGLGSRAHTHINTHTLKHQHKRISKFKSHVITGCTLPFQFVCYKLWFTLFYRREKRCCCRHYRRHRRCHFSTLAGCLADAWFWRVCVFRAFAIFVFNVCIVYATFHTAHSFRNP